MKLMRILPFALGILVLALAGVHLSSAHATTTPAKAAVESAIQAQLDARLGVLLRELRRG
ncbi:MAG: hypothetical protein D6729_09560 [Deltaproteobacteria bacterium]|nr:MAG: hypothetical protein D6729_09560 [Deltaproteobacteria bacterium]